VTTVSTTDPCPYCNTTHGVQPDVSAPPRVKAWSCTTCGTDWAVSVVRPDSRAAVLLGDLTATAREIRRLRWTLRRSSRWPPTRRTWPTWS
jgi:hypothetical protein